MTGISIRGTGRYLPDRVATNDDFAKFIDTSDEWIVSHTGISQRRIAVNDPTWYMGGEAAKKALDAAGLEGADIDIIIGTTVTPDYSYPSMACLVQEVIGAQKAFCFDISAACAAFSYALDMARRYLADEKITNVLIVSSETLSQVTDYTDRASCILFGDGAGACVVTRGSGCFGSYLHSDGAGAHAIYAKYPRHKTPFDEGLPRKDYEGMDVVANGLTIMDGHEVYRFATRAMPRAVRNACADAGIAVEDLDLVFPHQANLRIIQAAAKQLKMPEDKIYNNIQRYGNTSSATIPIALDECVRSGQARPGHIVCAVGFGSGLVYGASVFTI